MACHSDMSVSFARAAWSVMHVGSADVPEDAHCCSRRHFTQAATHVLKLSGWRMRVKLGALRAFMRKSAEDQQASHPAPLY